MNRRAMLGAAAAAAPLALATPALAQANPEVRWRAASSFPRVFDVLYGTFEKVAARVAQLTEGKFRIQTFPAGEIVGGLQVLDAVQAGTIEAGHTASYYYIGKEPGFAPFTAMCFGLNTRQLTSWFRHGGGNQLAAELFNEYNIHGITCGDTGAQMGGWFRNEITSVDQLRGLKFRITGLAGQLFTRLGAAPTLIAPADIYPSLERGVIDAAEFVGPHDDERANYVRVARFYYAPGFWEPGARLHFMSNMRAWNALPDQYKHALEVACGEADAEMVARYDFLNPQALRRLVAAGAQLRFWPRPVLEAAWKANEELNADLARGNPRFAKIMESYNRFRTEQFQWFRIAENSYDNFAFSAAQTVR
ncbi:TRAP transporter substrate-binding protein [Falsiroseomonas tokyonensis]|uniref:TRAP transporter substrate-binding protein n=1 Tax=Falsiroseomonas tokyonensis TaxID=430521 RepID=A0ABV7BSI0_9PROT|nr:TRAP transporter substrate-binding protein DctP [Falsiroseomonas tokyonensis]MBU8537072.1 TRAP transporter substrate-binding protein DctP [Falsiroseomonas tokyonensis]